MGSPNRDEIKKILKSFSAQLREWDDLSFILAVVGDEERLRLLDFMDGLQKIQVSKTLLNMAFESNPIEYEGYGEEDI